MAKKSKETLPKELLVYIFDYDNGEPLFNIARDISEIPEDSAGDVVGVYVLDNTYTFEVKRSLK